MENTNQAAPRLRTTPKDFFLQLGALVSLYVSTGSFLSLVFQVINRLFADPNDYYIDPYSTGIRVAISTLIIALPLYLWTVRSMNRDMAAHPEIGTLALRRWVTYIILFVASVAVAIDLIVLINFFLSGEVTIRFILKVLTVLAVALGIFAYYRNELKRDKAAPSPCLKRAGIAVAVVGLIAIVGSLFVAGSPFAVRDARLDEQRTNDLRNIQYQVLSFWQNKERLPGTLEELNDPFSYFVLPTDPQTEAAYEYATTGPLSFSLCATFAREDKGDNWNGARSTSYFMGTEANENWQHPSGKHCFERTIDPEMYPPRSLESAKAVPAPKF